MSGFCGFTPDERPYNALCPDPGAHMRAARERLFPGATAETRLTPDQLATLDAAYEADYAECDGRHA